MQDNTPQIKLFSYINKNNQVEDIKLNYGQKWSEIKTDNDIINSIFAQVSKGKETVEAKDLNILNKIFLFADKLINQTKDNEILELDELKKLKEKIDNKEIDIENMPEDNFLNINNWSEGTDRVITKIQINKPEYDENGEEYLAVISKELEAIGKIEGFEVVRSGPHMMLEDSKIRRADGNDLVNYYIDTENKNGNSNMTEYVKRRFIATRPEAKDDYENYNDYNYFFSQQGRVADDNHSFKWQIPKKQLVYGGSYLEGGNVLNTLKKDGTAGAIIGEESIGYTLNVMGLNNTPDNVKLAKKQIAADLGLKEENITYIPQYEYHIDMCYRPLHNGDIAIPDYEAGVKIAKKLPVPEDYTNETWQENIKETKKQGENIKEIQQEAEKKLIQAGYNLIRIPQSINGNYMNGITGTSPKTGKSFYITNSSGSEAEDNMIKKYFEKAGIDHVYFVSTFKYFSPDDGAIDCLTQEK